jgi:hypothetical protein
MFDFRFWKSGEIKDLEDICNFLKHYLQDFEAIREKVSPSLFRVTYFLMQENLDIYESIIALRRKGRFLSCLILGRSLLENSVNLQYIYQRDTEQRAHNFDLYPMKEYIERSSAIEDMPKEGVEAISRMREELKEYRPAGDFRNHWDGKNIWLVFSELDLKSTYTSLYKRLSNFSHSAFGNRNFQQDRPYINFLKGLLTKEIFIMVLESVRAVSERFDMDEAVARIEDCPPGVTLFFSTNPKRSEAKQSEVHK